MILHHLESGPFIDLHKIQLIAPKDETEDVWVIIMQDNRRYGNMNWSEITEISNIINGHSKPYIYE